MNNANKVAVLAVHGAWADGSSWNKVSASLLHQGVPVVAAQIPMTSFEADVEHVRYLLRRQPGPVVLAGHSYGAAVIAAAGAGMAQVQGLVFIAGIVPDEGETVGQVFMRAPAHAAAPALQPDDAGMFWVGTDAFAEAIAPDATAAEQALMAATQKPIAAACLGAQLGPVAWKEKPSWFLIAENDRMVAPDTQHFSAMRAGSTVAAHQVDHTPLLSAPQLVAGLIMQAVQN